MYEIIIYQDRNGKSQKTPKREIDQAKRELIDYLEE